MRDNLQAANVLGWLALVPAGLGVVFGICGVDRVAGLCLGVAVVFQVLQLQCLRKARPAAPEGSQ